VSKRVLEIGGMVGSTLLLIVLMAAAKGLGGWGFLGAFLIYLVVTLLIGIKLAGIPE